MTPARLKKLKRELANLRRRQVKARDIESIAKRLGRKKVNRGKEPMWESCFERLFVLSIPNHGGRDIPPGTKASILDQLEDDVFAWEDELTDDSSNENGSEKNDEGI